MDENVSDIQHADLNTEIRIINDKMVLENLAAIVFISLLMIVGIPGNITALLVYFSKFKPSTYRTFVVCLAIVDLAACCISMPFIIVQSRYPILFPHDEVCKVFNLLSYIPCVSSVFILITIAVERYRKICVPHGTQMSDRMAKYICIIDILAACCLSSPAAVIYGKRSLKIEIDNINGSSCSVSDDMVNTKYPEYFNFANGFVLTASILALSIIYSLIGKKIVCMRKTGLGSNQLQSCQNYSASTLTTEIDNIHVEVNKREEYLDSGKTEFIPVELDAITKCNKKHSKTIRTTRIIFMITAVFVFSFLPYLAFSIIAALGFEEVLLQNISFAGTVTYKLFKHIFFISNATNPIIYGFCDKKFMDEICRLYKNICGLCLTKK
ncbi:hypothetical protein ACJMK2_012987 [Sinanodonta woodiana]|uniref:G-protein coupled receptors family 1 profile domain-containing protein n=1 Tax=Sinanodonta woodiana TaxID=1069815 RepID=A0ABD3V9Z3_SINWO